MKNKIILLVTILLSGQLAFTQEAEKWNTLKSTHFIIYYKNAPQEFLDKLTKKAEEDYDKIADALGFRRYDFWLWDNRAKIYIYDDANAYQLATGQPIWSAGAAIPKEKIIHAFLNEKGVFDTVLLHEMGHIIFREFVGFDNMSIPLWLDEGVASYQESGRRQIMEILIKQAIKNNSLMDLEKLSSIDIGILQDASSINLFYAESLSVIDYLIKEFGSDNFVLFCQGLRDKKDLEGAIRYAYPFSDMKELNLAWQKYLKK